jgi:TRAP-type C4-dicarboxylate transport system substrate-binding protein
MVVSIMLVAIIATLSILAGCSTPAPATTSSSTASATGTQVAAPKVYELKFTDQYTPAMEDAQINELLGKLIEEHTDGKVKVTYYHAESLGKTGDFLTLLDGGVADIANIVAGWFPQNFSFFMGLELPLLGYTDRTSRSEVDWAVYKAGYLKEFDNYKVLSFSVSPAMNLYMKKNAPDVASLQGAKIRATNPTMLQWVDNLGASPISMASPDIYMALDRGTLDGVYTGYTNYLQKKYFEVCKNAIWNPISMGTCPVIMSKAAWDRLPPDVQADVDEAIEAYKTVFLDHFNAADAKAVDSLKAQGANVYSFEGDDAAKLLEAAAPLKEEWINAMQAKGLPAREMMEEVDRILASK